MTISVGSPFYPPDDTLLNINSTTGKLQLKPGTRGDILYAGASGVWTKLPKGVSGQYLAQGTNDPEWAVSPGEGWVFIEKLSPSGVKTITTTGTLTVYDEYLVRINVLGAGSSNCHLRFNGDTGANYSYFMRNSASTTESTAQAGLLLNDLTATQGTYAIVQFPGITPAVASGQLPVAITHGRVGSQGSWCGNWTGGNATQITSITLVNIPNSTNFTGTIEVFGRNRHA